MISMDKKYKTRSGNDVRILAIDRRTPTTDFSVIALVDQNGLELPTTYTPDGCYYANLSPHSLDLIEVKPVQTRWLNIYPNSQASSWAKRQDADLVAGEGRIACIEVQYTEGQGLT